MDPSEPLGSLPSVPLTPRSWLERTRQRLPLPLRPTRSLTMAAPAPASGSFAAWHPSPGAVTRGAYVRLDARTGSSSAGKLPVPPGVSPTSGAPGGATASTSLLASLSAGSGRRPTAKPLPKPSSVTAVARLPSTRTLQRRAAAASGKVASAAPRKRPRPAAPARASTPRRPRSPVAVAAPVVRLRPSGGAAFVPRASLGRARRRRPRRLARPARRREPPRLWHDAQPLPRP